MADTPTDADLLSLIGFSLAINTGLSIAQSVLYGFFMALILFGFRIQWVRYGHSFSGKVMLGVMIALFCLSTLGFAVGSFMTIQISNDFLVHNPELSLAERASRPNLLVQNFEVVAAAVNAFTFFLADGVVVWRASVICEQQRRFIIVPLFLLFSMGACSCVYVTLLAIYPHNETVGKYTDPIQTAVWALSLATNFVATAMIAYKVWLHRRFSRSFFLPKRSSKSEKIMVLLVDSGLIYCLIQVVYLTFHLQNWKSRTWAVVATVFLVLCSQLSAIYPTLIIVLVALRYTLNDDDDDAPDLSFSGRTQDSCNSAELHRHPGPLQFSSSTTGSTMDITLSSSPIITSFGGRTNTMVDDASEKC